MKKHYIGFEITTDDNNYIVRVININEKNEDALIQASYFRKYRSFFNQFPNIIDFVKQPRRRYGAYTDLNGVSHGQYNFVRQSEIRARLAELEQQRNSNGAYGIAVVDATCSITGQKVIVPRDLFVNVMISEGVMVSPYTPQGQVVFDRGKVALAFGDDVARLMD